MFGIDILVKFEQPEKDSIPIDETLCGMETLVKDVHCINKPLAIDVKFEGMEIDSNEIH